MEVRNCKSCGRLFNFVGGSITYRTLCPACIERLEDKFEKAKAYIEENKGATVNEVSEACDVSSKQVEQWVREERLFFSDATNLGIPCQKCGKIIKSGMYCTECKSGLQDQLNSFYKSPEIIKKKMKDSNARMRFLE